MRLIIMLVFLSNVFNSNSLLAQCKESNFNIKVYTTNGMEYNGWISDDALLFSSSNIYFKSLKSNGKCQDITIQGKSVALITVNLDTFDRVCFKNGKCRILKRIVDGEVMYYSGQKIIYTGSSDLPSQRAFWQIKKKIEVQYEYERYRYVKKGEEIHKIPKKKKAFKKLMLKLFGNCDTVKKNIENETWKKASDTDDIVIAYNAWLKSKTHEVTGEE